MKNTGTIVGIVLIVVLVLLLLGGAGMMGFGMMGPGMMGGYGFNPLGAILSLVFWVLIIGGGVWLAVWLVRGGTLSTPNVSGRESALDILKVRYAKGEITKEQFETMKRDLGV